MNLSEVYHQIIENLRGTGILEYIAVITGIGSVWYSRKENILVYPVGLFSTTIYIYLSAKEHLYGEASVNLYYTIMSIYGWILWARIDAQKQHVVQITYSSRKEWKQQLLFFLFFYVSLYLILSYLKKQFAPAAIPWADSFASATAYTGMWLMAKKKVESWYWWIATNFASIPLYFVKHFALTSLFYLILLIMAFWGLAEWMRKAKLNKMNKLQAQVTA